MAKYCESCGEKIGFLDKIAGIGICGDCLEKKYKEKKRLENEEIQQKKEAELAEKNRIIEEKKQVTKKIIDLQVIEDNDIKIIQGYNKTDIIGIFNEILSKFESDREVTEKELSVLLDFKKKLGLTNEDINFDNRVLPHQYVISLRSENKLPPVNLVYESGASLMNLKKGEIVHFACPAILKEIRIVSLGYGGGSHGISLRLMTGVSYRVGSHRGKMMKEERLVETSRGYLVLTNKRILLNPYQGKKAVNIPLAKVLTYNCYNNGLEIYKDGREKGFFFTIPSSGHVEVTGLCLGYLLKDIES